MARPSGNKTVATTDSVEAVLAALPEPRQADCRQIAALMQAATGHAPVMWGRMVGFGHRHYRHDSGREGDIFEIGFASGAGGKAEISLYLSGLDADRAPLLARLGRHRAGAGCTYLKRLSEVDLGVLAEMFTLAVTRVRARS